MKQLITTTLLLMMCILNIQAQDNRNERFSPEKFENDLKAFITKEASLTPQEAEVFFPIYSEMREKHRDLFEKQSKLSKTKPQDEKGCQKIIRESDAIDVEFKRIQQTYHEKFFKVLPASKVYDVIKAEDRFHRRLMMNWGQNHRRHNNNNDKKK